MTPQTLTAFANALLSAPVRHEPAHVLSAKVDRLGLIRAEMDRLAKEADDIRDELEAAALPAIEGMFYRASFSQCKGAERIDWQSIAKRFKPSAQLIRAHTKHGADSVRMNLTAKPTH